MCLYLGLSAAIEKQFFTEPWILRYLTGHPISKITTFLFFVGVASLAGIAWNVFRQFASLEAVAKQFLNPPASESGSGNQEPVDENQDGLKKPDADRRVVALQSLSANRRDDYLVVRLLDLIEFGHRKPSAASFEDELKYQSDLGIERKSNRYSLVRILIWATPMLGFLGTVLGISQALGGINVGPDNDFGQMMSGLQSSLFVAFDTTALALTLSMVLMFGQFLVDRFETQLLQAVDYRVRYLLPPPSESLSQLSKAEMEEAILNTNQSLLKQQTELWRATITEAESVWLASVTTANTEVQTGLADAIDQSVGELSSCLGQAISSSDHAIERRFQQWQVTLSENARQLERQQQEMNRQTELLVRLMAQIPRSSDSVNEAADRPPTAWRPAFRTTSPVDEKPEPIEARQMSREGWKAFMQPVDSASAVTEPKGSEPETLNGDQNSVILKFPNPATESATNKTGPLPSRKAA